MVPPEPVRVLHVTDPHLFEDAGGSLRGTVTYATLAAVVAHIRQQDWPADFVAMTGDTVQDDTAGAYEHFRGLMTPLGLPVLVVPGNHDVRPLMQVALSAPPFRYCESVRLRGWLVAGIDSCIDGHAGGRISDTELQRLRTLLRDAKAEHVAICLHHPPLPMHSRWLDEVGLYNADDFLEIIAAAGNVRVAIFGHVHQSFDDYRGATRIIGTPSTCAQFKPHSDEFALDSNPPAYRRIALHPDGSVTTELIPVNMDE